MSIIAWVIFGALTGWVASMLMGTNAHMGLLANIFIGILGAFVGGLIVTFIGGEGVTGFNLWSILVAISGAMLLLGMIKLFSRTE